MRAPTDAIVQSVPAASNEAMAWPSWFGDSGRPLLGWWHVPRSREARAVIVMSPAMARERLAADYSWRMLAATLADAGFAVLRFDYTATGDSAGRSSEPDLVRQWHLDLDTALANARAASDAPIVLLGHRLGATLAADCVRNGVRVDALVLWDPVLAGKRYLRELRAQQRMAVPRGTTRPPSNWADVPGDDLWLETATDISSLHLLGAEPLAPGPLLVLARPGAEDGFEALGSPAVESTPFQEALLNLDPILARPAEESISQITGWLNGVFGPEPHRVDAPAIPSARLRQVDSQGARTPDLVERAEIIAGRMFGISTERVEDGPGASAVPRETVLLVSAGVELHTGPARMWVELARHWASLGYRVVRCDLPGLGESAPRPGMPRQAVYEPTAIDDVEELVRALNPADPSAVTLVGMCSGAYNVLESAARLRSRRLVLLAFGWWLIPAEFARGERLAPERRLYRSALSLLRPVLATGQGRRLLRDHAERFWLTGSAYRLTTPLRPMQRLVEAGTDVAMVLGDSDSAHFTRRPGVLNRLRKRPGFQFHTIDGLDHGLLDGDARREASQLLMSLLARPDIVRPRSGTDERPSMVAL